MALDVLVAEIFLFATAIIGVIFGIINIVSVNAVDMDEIKGGNGEGAAMLSEHESIGSESSHGRDMPDPKKVETIDQSRLDLMLNLHGKISDGANNFLFKEYAYLFVFMILFGLVVFFLAESNIGEVWTVIAFELGAFTSIICGYIGMRTAVAANVRTTKECAFTLSRGFVTAYKAGSVLGFMLVGLALFFLVVLCVAYRFTFLPAEAGWHDYQMMFEKIAGYGLGGSSIALFGRVGGGIYTKAADVGADLAGKVVKGLPEDDIRNPGTIADNVGDNVGDIAGMGADLFGSLAESSCAALVVGGTSTDLVINTGAYYFPLCVTGFGILASIVTWFFATQQGMCCKIEKFSDVEKVIKYQLVISTLILIPGLMVVAFICLPPTFTFHGVDLVVTRMQAFCCCMCGLISGFLIGIVTEYYTSNEFAPVQEIAESCKKGAAPNIIKGLALGYLSCVIPVACIAITIYIAFRFADMYGIALAALGMLSNLCIALAIDGYGPIADNAGGIAEMCHLNLARIRTDKLDAAGNTTAAIGKGFAIGSACLVALALFGAFATRTELDVVNVLEPLQFAGLAVGAMLPYWFTALTMKAVGTAAESMIEEIARQDRAGLLKEGGNPDYAKCIEIATKSSLSEMFPPGILVMATPIVTGLLFGPKGVAGVLAGAIVSGIQMAFSQANSGGAWDNAKKFIEAGHLKADVTGDKDEEGNDIIISYGKGTEAHKGAVVGDTVGDPLKDTSGPSINILIKLMAIISLVFGEFFVKTSYLVHDKPAVEA